MLSIPPVISTISFRFIPLSEKLLSMASKLVLVLGISVFALFLLSPVTAIKDDQAVENKKGTQATDTPPEPVVPPRSDHYVRGCKRCCYLDERGCIACCSKGQLQNLLPTTAGRKEKAALVANSGHT